jgi:hypothetical protein
MFAICFILFWLLVWFEKPPPLMRRWKGFVAADFIRHAHSDHFPQVGKMIGRVD